ncbi:MAG TPA: hypothetical protein VHX52_10200 [Steroidobacteraceae bacterium]|nr:hypothetical protein [Steroidobacteraceae bacterium]
MAPPDCWRRSAWPGAARRGADVTVLEAEAGVNRSPRAVTYTRDALETFAELGVLREAQARAYRCGLIEFVFVQSGGHAAR